MDDQTLLKGFSELSSLAQDEYRESLQDIASDSNPQRCAERLGRLVGVMMKQPFATLESFSTPSEHTGAYRGWNLESREQFEIPEKKETWQYQTLAQIRQELTVDSNYFNSFSVYELAENAQCETGFFGYFARILRKYICGNPEIRKKVESAIEQAKGDKTIPTITPEMVVGSGGLALGAYLVQTIPILGIVGAPVIAAVVVILYTLGVRAFCEWTEGLRTNEDEK